MFLDKKLLELCIHDNGVPFSRLQNVQNAGLSYPMAINAHRKMPKAARPRICSYEKKKWRAQTGLTEKSHHLRTSLFLRASRLPSDDQARPWEKGQTDKARHQTTCPEEPWKLPSHLLRKEGSCAIHTRYCFGRSHTLHHHKSMQCRQVFLFLQTRKLKLRTARNITRMVVSECRLRRQTRSFWLQSPSLWRPMGNLLS